MKRHKGKFAIPIVVFQSPQISRIKLRDVSITLDTEDLLRAEKENIKFLVRRGSQYGFFIQIVTSDNEYISLTNWIFSTYKKTYYFLDKQNDFRKKNLRNGVSKCRPTPVYLNTYIKWVYDYVWFLTDLNQEDTIYSLDIKKGYRKTLNHYITVSIKNEQKIVDKQLHNVILNNVKTNSNLFIDHINRVRKDNRVKNLRITTPSENSMNKRGTNHDSKGVFFVKTVKKWRAQISYSKKTYSLGYFITKEDAQNAYNKKAKEISQYAFIPS